MNSFPGLNQNNGLVGPSSCDLATMRSVYQEEQQIAAASSYDDKRPESGPVDGTLVLSQTRLGRAIFSVPDLRQPNQPAKPFINLVGDKRPGTGRAYSGLTLKPATLTKSSFY